LIGLLPSPPDQHRQKISLIVSKELTGFVVNPSMYASLAEAPRNAYVSATAALQARNK
jgi:hypothetical protein